MGNQEKFRPMHLDDDVATTADYKRMYDFIAEGNTNQALDLFYKFFGNRADLVNPKTQRRLPALRRTAA